MAEQLDSLLKRIEDEAILRAENSARQILADAESKAAAMVTDAESRAARMLEEAERKIAQRTENGQKALEQAGRDLLLHVQKAIGGQFNALAQHATGELLPLSEVQRIIASLAEKHLASPEKTLSIDVPEKDREALVAFLLERFKQQTHAGIVIHPVPGLRAGFRVTWMGEDWRIDLDDSALSAIIAELVSPSLRAILPRAGQAG